MEYVRIFCEDEDIQPKITLQLFLRSIGIYVDDSPYETHKDDFDEGALWSLQPIADIYIVSDIYIERHAPAVDTENDDNSIIILKDGWESEDPSIKGVYYDDIGDTETFLNDFMKMFILLLEESGSLSRDRLVDTIIEGRAVLKDFIKCYLDYQIIPSILFTRCLSAQPLLYKIASENYLAMINALFEIVNEYGYYDFLDFCIAYHMYELNMICKINNKKYLYGTEEILQIAEELKEQYSNNEQIRLLEADVHLELRNEWRMAYDELMEEELSHCSYAYYKRGIIMAHKYHRSEAAVLIFKRAISKKVDYFKVWFELALCYEELGLYENTMRAYKTIGTILKGKLAKHILAPQEIEYLYHAWINLALIYKNQLHDAGTAYAYEELAHNLESEVLQEKYIDLVWDRNRRDEEVLEAIHNSIIQKMGIRIEEIF